MRPLRWPRPSAFVHPTCHAHLLGTNDRCKALETTLHAEIDPGTWAGDTSRPFDKPSSGRNAV